MPEATPKDPKLQSGWKDEEGNPAPRSLYAARCDGELSLAFGITEEELGANFDSGLFKWEKRGLRVRGDDMIKKLLKKYPGERVLCSPFSTCDKATGQGERGYHWSCDPPQDYFYFCRFYGVDKWGRVACTEQFKKDMAKAEKMSRGSRQ